MFYRPIVKAIYDIVALSTEARNVNVGEKWWYAVIEASRAAILQAGVRRKRGIRRFS